MSRTLLSEADGYELLKTYGIPVPRYAVVHTAEEAGHAAEGIGFPLVAKIVSPQVIHKSDSGGVITGIVSAAAAEKAFAAITATVRMAYPDAVIQGVILEGQQDEGLELIVGGRTDPAFGKVITIGMGGTLRRADQGRSDPSPSGQRRRDPHHDPQPQGIPPHHRVPARGSPRRGSARLNRRGAGAHVP